MTRNANRKGAANSRLIGFALTTALATAALTGCAASAPPAALSASKAEAQLAKGNYSKAIEHAEAAVTADPRNGAYRAVLGAAYLEAGRFGSAAASFQDAIDLGETSPRTALSLALALTAEGKQPAAQKVLKDWEGSIAAGDLGLAYSLAGAPDRGIAVLTNALRNGDNTAKTRQNLAYSYALAGQWKEARVMAGEDIPADRVSDRIAEWAAEVHPDLYRNRVAALLDVPAAEYDPGQPVQLALANFPSAEQLAAQAPVQPLPQPAPAAQVASARAAPVRLLPVGDPVDARAAAPQPARQPTVARQATGAVPSNVASAAVPASASAPRATAFAAPQPAPAAAQASAPRAAAPSVTPAVARAATPTVASSAARAVSPVLSEAAGAASGSHLVQLGSFSSEKGARRAWDIYVSRYPELASRDMVITRAVVRGKEYYRVAAAGYDAGSSRAMCGRVNRASADGCIAYAANKPLPGAVDNGRRFAMN
jgi:Flp pilus assembly protein TadD